MQRTPVGNGQFISEPFTIPVTIDAHGHRSETYTLVSEILVNVGPALGTKNILELEGTTNPRDCCSKLPNRSPPIMGPDGPTLGHWGNEVRQDLYAPVSRRVMVVGADALGTSVGETTTVQIWVVVANKNTRIVATLS